MRNLLLGVSVLASFFFFGFSLISNNFGHHPSKAASLVHKILNQTAQNIMKKHKIITIGEGVEMPGGTIRYLILEFESRERLSKDQLRNLLFEFSKEMTQNVNLNKEITEFLKDVPFTEKNVEIVIHNSDRDGKELVDPEIAVARISWRGFSYNTNDKDNPYIYKNTYDETLEEGIEIIRKQKSMTQD